MQKDQNQPLEEPFFITEEIQAEMIAAGYEFEPPNHIRTVSLSEILAELSDEALAAWPGELAAEEIKRRSRL
ncbi:hypothetical protein JHL22_00750 [Advenella sp. WQ 585]|uniref:Uncharacterized protein n=1 Tax=Advenella mandrilli TaxID=2800330 RepID=A0ABS1EAG0_9BURK|nr:hypothetical protein [Advenella mandrilli]MBK1779738.1 hypothetical protein [Advenella mandrilli]